MKIYDCFSFFNELELLEIRLNVLDPVVDHFILCEADTTHSGQPKQFVFEENKERFKPFLDKIIHVKVTDMPTQFMVPPSSFPDTFDGHCLQLIWKFISETNLFNKQTELYYGRDFFQKESIRRGMAGCNDEDIIISSDLDEIPRPELLERVRNHGSRYFDLSRYWMFEQKSYYYYLNMLQQPDWYGSRMAQYKSVSHFSYNELRKQSHAVIHDGGWHFSFQGGVDRVIKKIESYSHQELNTEQVKAGIKQKIEQGIDPYDRGKLTKVPFDNSFPKYIHDNINRYADMIVF